MTKSSRNAWTLVARAILLVSGLTWGQGSSAVTWLAWRGASSGTELPAGDHEAQVAIVGHEVGVGHGQADPIDRYTQFLRHGLREQRPGPLAHLDLSGERLVNAALGEPHPDRPLRAVQRHRQ